MNPLRTYRPRQSFKPRNRFPQPGKPRSTRGISQKRKILSLGDRPAKYGRRVKAIAHVGKHWKNKPAIIYRRDEKEICNTAVPEGLAEYLWRILLMWVRQDGFCCDCGEPLKLSEATFEHENGRGAGKRDDRIAIFDGDHFVKYINGAAHKFCNSRRGSRRTEIFHGNNCFIEAEKAHSSSSILDAVEGVAVA